MLLKKICFYGAIIFGATHFSVSFAEQRIQIAKEQEMPKILTEFTQYAELARKAWNIPGMSIAIVKGNQIIYAQGFGERNLKHKPVTPETIFGIASLTKSFTVALLAKQIEAGKYDWNTKVTKLYPEFKLFDPIATNKFTVKDLVIHNSGLPDHATQTLGDFGYDQNYILHALRFIKPEAALGEKFAYQNVMFAVAQKIIEKYSGKNYADNLHQLLFSPLNMKQSYLVTESINHSNNIAQPFEYYHSKNIPLPNNWYYFQPWSLALNVAADGIKSNVNDMAKWLIFNMNNGEVNNKQIISVENMQFIHMPHTIIKKDKDGNVDEAYCAGWFYKNNDPSPYVTIYHSGDEPGVKALMEYIPQLKIGIVILTNQFYSQMPETLAKRFFALYLHQPLQDWSRIELQKREQSVRKAFKVKDISVCNKINSENLKKYTGVYFNEVYGKINVVQTDKHLLLTIGPKKTQWKLTRCQNNEFKAYWSNPNDLDLPMLIGDQKIVKFIPETANHIAKMQINYLNGDGSGVFNHLCR